MTETTTVPQTVWTVSAEFTDRDDAVAFMELVTELGVVTKMTSHSINAPSETPVRGWRIGKVVLGSMQPGRSYTSEHFRAVLQEAGFAPASSSSVLTRLVQQGDVKRIAQGVFKLARRQDIVCETCTTPETCAPVAWCTKGNVSLPVV